MSIDEKIRTSIGAKASDGIEQGNSPASHTLYLSKSSQKGDVNSDKEGGQTYVGN